MKNLSILIAVIFGGLTFSYGQPTAGKASDTVSTMYHTDPGTEYQDESGKKLTETAFMDSISSGGYAFTGVPENGRLKRAVLKKRTEKIISGMAAPDFSGTDINGKPVSLKGLKGKTVVVDCWFTSCGGCILEMPELNALQKYYEVDSNVVFLAVTYNSNKEVREFLEKRPFTFDILPEMAPMLREYGIQAYPSSMVIDAEGRVVYTNTAYGSDTVDKLAAAIKSYR